MNGSIVHGNRACLAGMVGGREEGKAPCRQARCQHMHACMPQLVVGAMMMG
jgi:hypothetical protein